MKGKIRSHIENLPNYKENPFIIKDDDSLFNLGLIDSMMVLDLVAFFEDSFNVEIDPDDLTRSNFESINSISVFLERKLNGRYVESSQE